MYIIQWITRLTHHTISTLDSRMVPDHISHVVCVGNLSQVPTKLKQASTPRRSINNQRSTDPAVILGGLILPPTRKPCSRGERFQPSGYTTTSAYGVHKHQYAISTFNTCSRGSIHRSLTNTGGATPFEVPACHIPLVDLSNQLSTLST
jgi:hypothetical protein